MVEAYSNSSDSIDSRKFEQVTPKFETRRKKHKVIITN